MTGKKGEDVKFLICVCDQLSKGGGFAVLRAPIIMQHSMWDLNVPKERF